MAKFLVFFDLSDFSLNFQILSFKNFFLCIFEENKRKYKSAKMKDFLKIYGIEMHHDRKEGLYILVDADNRVVWKGCSTESLTGLFNMIENLYKVGSDIISCFFKDVYIDEI